MHGLDSRQIDSRYFIFGQTFGCPRVLFLVLTSANETKCQNLLFNNFVPLFCFSVKFVALEAYEVGLASGKGP